MVLVVKIYQKKEHFGNVSCDLSQRQFRYNDCNDF